MSTLVTRINAISEASFGVNILDRPSDPVVAGVDVATIGLVMDLPWGPVNEVIEVATLPELYRQFAPAEFDNREDYPSLLSLLNKTWPSAIQINRIFRSGSTDAAAASATANDGAGSPAPSTITTARYVGASGNLIRHQWVANADGVSTSRDLIVSVVTAAGVTTYSKRHKAVATGGGTPVITDPGDRFVIVTPHGSIDEVPAVMGSAVALTGGTDGVAVAADWTGAADTFDGIRAFLDDNLGVDVIIACEVDAAFIDDANDELIATAEAVGCRAVLCTPEAQTKAQIDTYIADYRSENVSFHWPKVYTINKYDVTRPEVLVDGNSFAAVAVASVPPQDNPGGAPGARYLRGITGVETGVTKAQFESLKENGVNGWFNSTANGGYIIYGGVNTQIADNTRLTIARHRMFSYITGSLAGFLERFVGRLADIDLESQSLGPVTQQQDAAMRSFLQVLLNNKVIRSYNVDLFSGNTLLQMAAGTFVVLIEVGLYGSQDNIVIDANIGPTVGVNFSEV